MLSRLNIPDVTVPRIAEGPRVAAEFLLPESAMRDHLEPPITLASLARLKPRWGVSMQALIRRAYDLNVITERQYRYLFEQMTHRGWRNREPTNLDIGVEVPHMFRQMVGTLYGEPNNIPRYASDMHVTIQIANEIINAFGGSLPFPGVGGTHVVSEDYILDRN